MPTSHVKEFTSIFRSLIDKYSYWQVWADFCLMSATAISNAVDKRHYDERENQYLATVSRYTKDEANLFSKLFAITAEALEANPEQDFLGELYMQLEMGNHWNGQYFTPYYMAYCMAELQLGNSEKLIAENGFITVNDPCCGSGVLLIAYANTLQKREINYQRHVLFVAQDIDPVVAMMCYVGLSLLGCAAEILVGNTLSNGPVPGENRWYTPMYFHDVWHWRRVWHGLSAQSAASAQPPDDEAKELTDERAGNKTAQGMVGAQRGDDSDIWIFGGFAG